MRKQHYYYVIMEKSVLSHYTLWILLVLLLEFSIVFSYNKYIKITNHFYTETERIKDKIKTYTCIFLCGTNCVVGQHATYLFTHHVSTNYIRVKSCVNVGRLLKFNVFQLKIFINFMCPSNKCISKYYLK